MTRTQLPRHEGAFVHITVDGQPALGTLSLSGEASASVRTICFTQTKRSCPAVQHKLTATDIESLIIFRPRELRSSIALRSDARAGMMA